MLKKKQSEEEKKAAAKLIKGYKKLLNAPDANEMSIKPYLDAHPTFIPTPWMLNHQLHFNLILPQFAIFTGMKTDYVYLTKSSTSWWCVLVEFESPAGRFFTNGTSVKAHADLNAGLSQIDNWRDYLGKHKDAFLSQLDPIRHPMSNNPVQFRYVLVMGRRSEFENSPTKVDRYSDYETGTRHPDVRVLTYDAVASEFKWNRPSPRHTIKRSGNKFVFEKYNPEKGGDPLWTYVTKDHLKLSKPQIGAARDSGIRIDEWLEGTRLSNWGRDVYGTKKKSIRNLTKK
jgi:hypothetical protein